MLTLTEEEITEISAEINLQWDYHLLTRLVFNSKFPKFDNYSTYGFYSSMGEIKITLPPVKTDAFKRAAKGVGYWHNQNYVIRVFGILDSYGIMKYGKDNKIKVICLIDKLRNNVGAHSSGKNISRRNDLKKSLALINELFRTNHDIENATEYPLAIDHVLLPMKDKVLEFIRT